MQSSRLVRSVVVATLTLGLAFLSGCATYRNISDYPNPNQPTSVSVGNKSLSKMSDLPVGALYDAEHQVVVVGHQKGLGAGMMFGLVGVIVADQVNKSNAEKQFGSSAHSGKVDLGATLKSAVQEEVEAQKTAFVSVVDKAGKMEVTPYAVFTVLASGDAKLHVMLRTELLDKKGELLWSGRFYAPAEGAYKLEGDEGWMKGDRFAVAAKEASRAAFRAFLLDLQGKLRETKRKVSVEALLPFMGDRFFMKMNALVVDETESDVVLRMVAGDAFLASGTYVFKKSEAKLTSAEFSDPRK